MKMNKEIASQIVVLFENCNQLKLLAASTPDYPPLRVFADQLYQGLNHLLLIQNLQNFESSLSQIAIEIVDFQTHNSINLSTEVNEQIEKIKIYILEFQKTIENE
jgi:hypothetical protein